MKFLVPLIIVSLAAYDTIFAQDKEKLNSFLEQMKAGKDTLNFLHGDVNKKIPLFNTSPFITYNMPFMQVPENIDYKIKIYSPPKDIDYRMNFFRVQSGIEPLLRDSLFKMLPHKKLK